MTVVMVNARDLRLRCSRSCRRILMGTAVGVVVLFVLRPALDSARFTLPVCRSSWAPLCSRMRADRGRGARAMPATDGRC